MLTITQYYIVDLRVCRIHIECSVYRAVVQANQRVGDSDCGDPTWRVGLRREMSTIEYFHHCRMTHFEWNGNSTGIKTVGTSCELIDSRQINCSMIYQ